MPIGQGGSLAPDMAPFFGMDESGTGEVLGDLVVVCLHAKTHLPYVRDSKRDRPRDWALVNALLAQGKIGYRYISISPAFIDKHNVKQLITQAQRRLLQANVGEGYVDSHHRDSDYLHRILAAHTPAKLQVKCRMDENNSLVAAASLFAKDLRKTSLLRIQDVTGVPVGSGNLMDKTTRRYLLAGHTEGLRRKWSLSCLDADRAALHP